MADRYTSLKQGLVGCWIPSISGSGLLLPDLSGRGNNGALTNMDASDWVSSQYGRALDLDGVNDYVSCGPIPTSAGNITASAWVWRNANDGFFRFVCGNSNVTGALIDFHLEATGGDFRPLWGSNPYYRPTTSLSLSAQQWYHIAMVRRGTAGNWTAEMYVNGAIKFTGTTTINPPDGSSYNFSIGRSGDLNSANTYFAGYIADARAYNRALTESEIRLLSSEPGIGFKPAKKLSRFSQRFTYKPPKPRNYGLIRNRDPDTSSLRHGLVAAYCPSISGQGNVLPDLVGGNHGTLTNMDASDWVSSGDGRALDFDGVNDFVPVGLPFGPTSSGVKTISLWCYFRSSADSYLVTNYDASSNGFSVLLNSDRTIGIARTGATNNIRTTASVALSNWTHIFVQIDATGVIWINGIESARGSMLSELTSTNNVRTSGRWVTANSGSAALLNAQIDDIRFFNRALTEPEIRLLASRRGIGLQNPRDELLFHQLPSGSSRRLLLTGQT